MVDGIDTSNAPETLDMNTFWSVSDDFGGLAKACRYVVRIDAPIDNPAMRDLTYLCEATEYPGRAFQNVDLRYYGPSFKLPYQTAYEDINMTFLCRTEGYERMFFDDWMEIINPSTSYDFRYRDQYRSTITLFQLGEAPLYEGDAAPQAHYTFTLFDAFPILINPQPITWVDDNFLRLTVTFTFSKWRRKGLDRQIGRSTNLIQGVPSAKG